MDRQPDRRTGAETESTEGLPEAADFKLRHYEAVEFGTLEWVDWFNNRPLLEVIGIRPPAEAEAAYHRQREHTALAA